MEGMKIEVRVRLRLKDTIEIEVELETFRGLEVMEVSTQLD